jgi:hypothetical protein
MCHLYDISHWQSGIVKGNLHHKIKRMNTAHWHLLLNHIPVMGVVIGALILVAGFVLKNNETIKQTALGVFVFSALFAIPAYLTGEGAEEAVEKMPGVAEALIEKHEDLGKAFSIVTGVLGIISLLTFIADWRKNKIASGLYVMVLLLAIGTSVFAKQLGTSGGEIRHTEIRSGAQAMQQPETGGQEAGENGDD